MSTLAKKLEILADSAKYDASCASTKTARNPAAARGICHSYTPDGRCVSLLKILLSTGAVNGACLTGGRRVDRSQG